jgi:hypothetical protein
MQEASKIALFEGKKIRKIFFEEEWWFSVADVTGVLTDSPDPGAYWRKLKQRLIEEGSEVVTFCHGLKLEASDGKKYETDCANTAGLFRIIQSIPSPKAEPFKRWLAKVGYERVQEIEDPELGMRRMRELYRQKGYSEQWIEERVRGIVAREHLTNEWDHRGADTPRDYGILTAEISKAAFGVTPSEYKQVKGLKRENLRDHMDTFELLFTSLAEHSTAAIHRTKDSQGVEKLSEDAKAGGTIAGDARKQLEKRLGKSIMTNKNLKKSEDRKNPPAIV